MTAAPRCPICDGATEPLLLRRAVPVLQNGALRTAAEARNVPVGTLDLRLCAECPFVFNAAWDGELLRYDGAYENRQDCSAAFRAHLGSRIGRVHKRGGVRAEVVEVGCGQGDVLEALCARPGWQGRGYDPAVRRSAAPGCTFYARILGVGEASDSADVVISRHVIEHVPSPRPFLALLTDVRRRPSGGRDGGLVFLETPSLPWILREGAYWDLFYEHTNYFTAAALHRLAARVGLADVRVRTVFDGQYYWLEGPVSVDEDGASSATDEAPASALAEQARSFAREHVRWLASWRDRLGDGSGPTVVWGAGAKGATFATLVDPDASKIAAVVDISPHKQGCYLPVSAHPVVAPAALSALRPRRVVVMNPSYRHEVLADLQRLGLDPSVENP